MKKSLTRQTLLNSKASDKNPKPQTRLILIKILTAKWDALPGEPLCWHPTESIYRYCYFLISLAELTALIKGKYT